MLDAANENGPIQGIPALITRDQLAEVLGVGRATIYRYERKGAFVPRVILPGGCVRYRVSDVKAYIDGNGEG